MELSEEEKIISKALREKRRLEEQVMLYLRCGEENPTAEKIAREDLGKYKETCRFLEQYESSLG